MKSLNRLPVVVSLVLFPACTAICQSQTPSPVLAFDVATVKPNASSSPNRNFQPELGPAGS